MATMLDARHLKNCPVTIGANRFTIAQIEQFIDPIKLMPKVELIVTHNRNPDYKAHFAFHYDRDAVKSYDVLLRHIKLLVESTIG